MFVCVCVWVYKLFCKLIICLKRKMRAQLKKKMKARAKNWGIDETMNETGDLDDKKLADEAYGGGWSK